MPTAFGGAGSIHSCCPSEKYSSNSKVLKTLNLGFLGTSFGLFESLCVFPNSANYYKAPTFPWTLLKLMLGVIWAPFLNYPLLFQQPCRWDNGLTEVAICIWALNKPISLLFLDCSLSKQPQNILSETFANPAIFHQGFWE